MILNSCCLEQFVQDTAEKQIIIFGAGVLCRVWFPYLFAQYDIDGRVAYCVDNQRFGEQVNINGRMVPVYSFDYLRTHAQSNQVILISASAFQEIVEQLDQCPELSQLNCYIGPMMFIENHRVSDVKLTAAEEPKIPKKIHYIWFSDHSELPPLVRRCVESWRRFCPDYEIVRWDAANYDVTKNDFVRRAYRNKDWSFVSDYARMDILHEHGGIYFDTDVELVRGIDDLLYQDAFISFEKWPVINSGGGMGAVKGFPLLREIMKLKEDYAEIHARGECAPFSSGFYETETLRAHGLRMNGETQAVAGMSVYSYDYFHPFDYMSGKCEMTKNTHAIHHFNRSWVHKESLKNGSAYYRLIQKRIGSDS